MTTIAAYVIADSVGLRAPRLLSLILTYPLIIHAEFMTHRVFSRNAASSRAIPIEKMIKAITLDPFVPLVWVKEQKGMQGYEELSPSDAEAAKAEWLRALQLSLSQVNRLRALGVHKQTVNRLLGPYAHIKVLVTGNYWRNFLKLRDHPKAEPHMRILAQKVAVAIQGSTPRVLSAGEWHLPFVPYDPQAQSGEPLAANIRLSIGRSASISYKTVDDFDMTPERANRIYEQLLVDDPIHASPGEHQAQIDGWQNHSWNYPWQRGNLAPGWRQYRKMLPNEADMEAYV